MYQDCKKLTNVSMPPNVQNMNKMFSFCINLKAMPEIPETAKSMSASFEGDSACTDYCYAREDWLHQCHETVASQ